MQFLLNSKLMRTSFAALLLAFFASVAGGCATMEGAGKDIQSAGEALEDEAEEASN
ncbi:entericidin A/B family lipoprotein [Alteromonas halophila]|uniref:Entericidin A/B family lipoprotein n=1 Tax=Alteromonas halophila TaxID=516698 RepID=A0A918JMY0_9ALTE|nr:entericidin A/B family lipoprotein [Alteromonas halophila]GGW89507.1 hypothetical protein GCM10007391_24730 [Alteromonas halophila]